jgi:phage shock protein A
MSKFSQLWSRAITTLEDEVQKATENLRRGISKAGSKSDMAGLREAYERVERSLALPSRHQIQELKVSIARLAARISDLEKKHGIETEPPPGDDAG